MMKETFIYWAQALDNTSPDHIEVHGKALSPDDIVRRQEAVSLISGVVKNGSKSSHPRGVQLSYDGKCFVMEVHSVERDCVGRSAPIVCYGDYDLNDCEELVNSVEAGFDAFAKRTGRSILPEHLKSIREAFVALKKKSSKMRLVQVALIGLMVFVLLSLVYWLRTLGSAKM